jgi:hypothetical protein
MQEQVVLNLKTKTVVLLVKDFGDSPVDTEELLQVDMNNILADIVTFPVLFNRISVIKAEVEDLLRERQLDFDIFVAQVRDEYRKSLVHDIDDGKGKGGLKKKYPTVDEVDDALTRDPRYKVKRTALNAVKKEVDIVDALYWSAKSKDKKLEAISAKIKPEEFESEILEGMINSVLIKVHKNIAQVKR